ncbi:hypothetical protein AB1Y20_006845 [Prymnesium parvum]|uniref:UDENN domain-containing protein n=1 Tax=Prymnesium parvum TaxID=97485 RepID=A0AB34IZH4_PRYPA
MAMAEPFHFFCLENQAVLTKARHAPSPASQSSDALSIKGELLSFASAWNNFISPAPVCAPPLAVPAASLADAAVRVSFHYPPLAAPPPRLAAFALPSWVPPQLLQQPRDVCFCLSGDQYAGGRLFGFSLQFCEECPPAGVEAPPPAAGTRVRLGALVLLTPWPAYELFKALLRFILSQSDLMWPALPLDAAATPPDAERASRLARLSVLLARASNALTQSLQELKWLSIHPLWLPTPLAPLFKGLGWEAVHAAYLLVAALTDQKIVLHSTDPERLYCASCALKALITPLEYPHVYIPLLPAHLMEFESVRTLLLDSCTPYLIGCETQLLEAIGNPPANSVIADLDGGVVHRAPGTEWFDERAPPFFSLCQELQLSMGDCMQFRPSAAQTACLRFVVDVLNLSTGFLARSMAPADADALSRARLLDSFAKDATERCKRAGLDSGSMHILQRALQQSRGALLAEVCSGAAGASAATRKSGTATWGLGDLASLVADGAANPSSSATTPPPVCGVLANIFAAQPFRDWWGDPQRSRSPERLQWMQFRAKGIDIAEYLRENRQSINMLQRSVHERLHSVYSSAMFDTPSSAEQSDAELHAPEMMDAADSVAASGFREEPHFTANDVMNAAESADEGESCEETHFSTTESIDAKRAVEEGRLRVEPVFATMPGGNGTWQEAGPPTRVAETDSAPSSSE